MIRLHPSAERTIFELMEVDNKSGKSVYPHEHSGCFAIKNGMALIRNIDKHDKNESVTPSGNVTFHTHNVPEGHKYDLYMSTYVPSWEDVALMLIESVTRNLRVHIIFTPNFMHTIHISPGVRASVMTMEPSAIQRFVEPVYQQSFKQNNVNYGK